jgi:hypothetical protein
MKNFLASMCDCDTAFTGMARLLSCDYQIPEGSELYVAEATAASEMFRTETTVTPPAVK